MADDSDVPKVVTKWAGKSVGGYTFLERTDKTLYGYYAWTVRCDACGRSQTGLVSPARLNVETRSGRRRLCENPDCPQSVGKLTVRANERKATIAAVVAAGGSGRELAERLGVSRQRAKQILDATLTPEQADARLAGATGEQLLAAVMKRPKSQRRMIAIAIEPERGV